MTLAEMWSELEARMPEERVGRMVRRIHPESAADLYVSVDARGGGRRARRALELQVPHGVLEGLEIRGGTRHVSQMVEDRGPARSALLLGLEQTDARDLFAAMCTDVAETTAAKTGADEAVTAWTGRFEKWRRMLQGSSQGLSPRRQRGLYAELLSIRDHLAPEVGINEAILAWKGPDGAPRDFELGGFGVEIKSSAANEPQVVLIHGERQLDDSGLDALVLVHQSLEVLRDAGESLPRIVSDVRHAAEGHVEAGTLEDRLLQSEYADVHEPLYRRTGYEIRRTSFFHIHEDFPRITEDDLRDGVGAVRYSLAIDACRDFEVAGTFLSEHVGAGHP